MLDLEKSNVDYSLYLITERNGMSAPNLEIAVKQAILGGVTLVQLREKNLSTENFIALATRIKLLTDHYRLPLIINDNLEVMLAVNAAGIHLGQNDLPTSPAKKLIGPEKILGISVTTIQEAKQAIGHGADYLGIGAMFKTTTKPDAKLVTFDTLRAIRKLTGLPLVAIGGINEKTIKQFNGINLDGIAVSSAIMQDLKTTKKSAQLKKLFIKTIINTRDFKSAIFDLDGTLFYTANIWPEVNKTFFRQLKITLDQKLLKKIENSSFKKAAEHLIKVFNLNYSTAELVETWAQLATKKYATIKIKPQVKEYLTKLKMLGIKTAIVTGLPGSLYKLLLKNNEVTDLFDTVISEVDHQQDKTNSEVYLLAAQKLKTLPANCLVFDDLICNLAAAKKSGMQTLLVGYISPTKLKTIDGYLNNFAQAPLPPRYYCMHPTSI